MDGILNFFQTTPAIGTSGQPTREQFGQIGAAGYEVVVNLAMPDSEDALEDEGSLVAKAGMVYVNIPIPFDAPRPWHLARFIAVMDGFKDDRVWVHCQVNARVSAFMFKYMTGVRGAVPETVTSPLLTAWRDRMDDVWKDVMSWDVESLD